MLLFGLSVAFSANVTIFSTLRFFEGFCLAGLALSLYVLRKYPLPLPVCRFPSLFFHLLWLFQNKTLEVSELVLLVILGQRG